jgi:hypothetical protein
MFAASCLNSHRRLYAGERKERGEKVVAGHSFLYPHAPVRYPQNGRTLTDDVVDVFLSMYANGKVTGDKVGPHRDLLDEFPYLGPPHD